MKTDTEQKVYSFLKEIIQKEGYSNNFAHYLADEVTATFTSILLTHEVWVKDHPEEKNVY